MFLHSERAHPPTIRWVGHGGQRRGEEMQQHALRLKESRLGRTAKRTKQDQIKLEFFISEHAENRSYIESAIGADLIQQQCTRWSGVCAPARCLPSDVT